MGRVGKTCIYQGVNEKMEEIIKEFTKTLNNIQNHSIKIQKEILAEAKETNAYYHSIVEELKKINLKEFVEVRRNV